MRIIGFSSGTLDPHDPEGAIGGSLELGLTAIELSALRLHELEAVADALSDPRLERFAWVSIHAPSDIPRDRESEVARRLIELSGQRFPVVVHPDVISTPQAWAALGSRLLLENMDRRKQVGRFADEFEEWFDVFPEAGLCLDVAHVRQVDPTLTEGMKFVRMFGDRLREIHVSEVTSTSRHRRISLHASAYLKGFLRGIRSDIPLILESVLGDCRPIDEVRAVASLLGENLESPV